MTRLTDFQLLILEKDKINCVDVEALLDDYVEHALTPTLKARLDTHICDCDECQDLLEGYRLTIELAAELGERDTQIPGDVQKRLRSALNERLGLSLRVPS